MSNLLQTLRDTYLTNPAAALNMLPELFKQYDEGLIKVLPCKVGELVYRVIGDHIELKCIDRFEIFERNVAFCSDNTGIEFKKFGKTVFFTHKAAKKALDGEKK